MLQNDDGDCLYVIEEGVFECKIRQGGEDVVVKTCEPGDAFGELALLYNCPRAASVDSTGNAILWKLDRATFNAIVKDAASTIASRQMEDIQFLYFSAEAQQSLSLKVKSTIKFIGPMNPRLR